MLILCKADLKPEDFDRLTAKLSATTHPLRWSRRRGRLAILLERANASEPALAPVLSDPAVDYVLADPSEDEIGRVFSRRDLINFSLASTGALAAAALFAPVGVYLAAPAGERTATGDVFVASADGKGSIPVRGTRAKMVDGEEYLIVHTEPGRYHAVSRTCTHSGVCLIDWDDRRHQFVCPCHRGLFDLYGNVVGGPPPRPLKSKEVVVRDGRVYLKRDGAS